MDNVLIALTMKGTSMVDVVLILAILIKFLELMELVKLVLQDSLQIQVKEIVLLLYHVVLMNN